MIARHPLHQQAVPVGFQRLPGAQSRASRIGHVMQAVSKVRHVARHRDVTDEERAAARYVIGHGRMLATTVSSSVRRQQRERGHDQPGIAI